MKAPPFLFLFVNDLAFLVSHRSNLLTEAQHRGWRIGIGFLNSQEDSDLSLLRESFAARGIELFPLQASRFSTSALANIRLLLHTIYLIRSLKPDIVHAIAAKGMVMGSITCRLLGVPIVCSASGLGYLFLGIGMSGYLRRSLSSLLYRLSMNSPRVHLIVQNPDDQALFESTIAPRARIRLIQGAGVDLNRFRPRENERKGERSSVIIAFVGRLLREKGVLELLVAAEACCKRNPLIQFIFAGSTVLHNPGSISDAEISRFSKTSNIEFLGHVADTRTVFEKADIVCLPSYREGLSLSLLEAAACGCALIASDVPGCRDICLPGRNGILVPARSAERLAEAVLSLAEDRIRLAEYARQSREVVREGNFSSEEVVAQTFRTYCQAMDELTTRRHSDGRTMHKNPQV